MNAQRRNIANWLVVFSIVNTLMLYGLGFFYLKEMSFYQLIDPLYSNISFYYLIAIFSLIYLSLFACIGFLPSLLLLPISYFIPKRIIIVPLSICLSSLIILYILADATVFKLYNFHLNPMLLSYFVNIDVQKIFALSTLEWGLLIFTTFLLLCVEISIANLLWKPKKLAKWGRLPKWYFILMIFGVLVAYQGFLVSLQYGFHPLYQNTRILPIFSQWIMPYLPLNKFQRFHVYYRSDFSPQSQYDSNKLIYPIHPIHCETKKNPLNILILGIDAWRYDKFNATVTPHIYQFAKNEWQFHHHLSGGNATIPGIFSMFYGLPSTYWLHFVERKHGPVFFKLLNQQHYQLGVFTSDSSVHFSADVTSFRDVKNLLTDTPGDTPFERDASTTDRMITFLKQRDKKRPFFGFVFYNGAHSYCADGSPLHKFQPSTKVCNRLALNEHTDPAPYLNLYQNALYYLDGEMEKILKTLKQEHLLENTIVIITSDHGEEFNDTHRNLWGHASGFTDVQLQIPMIIHWPGKKSQHIHYMTTHHDLAPTLIHDALGCHSPIGDYSVGHNLFNSTAREPFIVSSYNLFSVREAKQIDRFYANGQVKVHDTLGKLLPEKKVKQKIIELVYQQNRKFIETDPESE